MVIWILYHGSENCKSLYLRIFLTCGALFFTSFLMHRMCIAVFAHFFQLDLALHRLSILRCPVVDMFAFAALKFE